MTCWTWRARLQADEKKEVEAKKELMVRNERREIRKVS